MPGPSIEARCSIRLSTPPSEVARFHRPHPRRRCDRRAPRRPIPGSTACSRSRPPSAARRRRGRDAAAGRDRAPGRPSDARTGAAARAMALFAWARRAQMQRAHAAHQQIGLEGPEDGALPLADRDDPVPERVGLRAGERAGDDVGMAVQHLRRRMHDDVGAERRAGGYGSARRWWNRPRAARRPHGRSRPRAAMSVIGPERVRGRLDPDELGAARRTAARSASRSSVSTKSTLSPQRVAFGQQPVAQRPVHHLRGDDVIARVERLEHRRRRRHAGGEQQRAGSRLLQHRDHASASRTVALSGRP